MTKRPPWYRPFERAKYDALNSSYNDFKARILDDEDIENYDVELPASWKNKAVNWLYGSEKGLPKGSGVGLVQSPYADIYTKIYGVVPINDLPKFRQMYRNFPDVQQAIEMQVNLALGKGFIIVHKNKKIAEYLEEILYNLDIYSILPTIGRDMLTYGNSFTEICWEDPVETKEQMYEVEGNIYTKNEIEKNNFVGSKIKKAVFEDSNSNKRNFVAYTYKRKAKSRVVSLKTLDPIYMRVRRDSWGNVFGYIQYMAFPPVLINPNQCIHIKHRPTSTGYESAYGVSLLMSLVKNTDLLNYFENDAAVWVHYKAVPPLTIKGGSSEKPYSDTQMVSLMKAMKTRSATSMIFVKGDVSIEEMETVASDLHLDWWINYLLLKRNQALGVPNFLMGQSDSAGRSSAQVLVQDFITRLQVLQNSISKPLEQYLFRQLIDEKFGKEVPNAKIVWKPIIEESPDMRTQRLVQLLQAGALSINEVRVESGFNALVGESFDKPRDPLAMSQIGVPTGFPQKEKKKELPYEQQIPSDTPESRLKLNPKVAETERLKRLQLMIEDNEFRETLLNLTAQARFNLKQDDCLVKDVKKMYVEAAKKVIDKHILASFIVNKNFENGDNEKGVEQMKVGILKVFTEALDEMIKAKEEGNL